MHRYPNHSVLLPSRIFLLGFMGSGKSTLGPMVANSIGYAFADLDEAIQEQHSKPITALFNELGETGFRAIETAELKRVCLLDGVVVAAGGGVVTVAANRKLIDESGLSVYLRLSPSALAARLRTSRSRPMLFGPDGRTLAGAELEERIRELIGSRSPFYERADVIVDLDRGPVGRSVDRVVRAIYSSAKSST